MQQSSTSDTRVHPQVQFDALFEKTLDAVVGMDLSGRIIAWNSSAEALFGWSAAEAMGALMSDTIIPEQHRKPHNEGLKRYRATGHGPVLNNRVQITALRRSGEEFPIELSILPLDAEGSKVFYAFIRSREGEERINRERELRAREAEILAAISAAHLENMETEAFIELCLERICQVSGWAVGHFYRFDNPSTPSRLVPSGVWHISDERFRAAAAITEEFTFGKGEGLPGRVWEREAAVIIENIAAEPDFSRRRQFLNIGLVKGFAFPLRNCGTLSGVMEFFGPGSARAESDLIRFADIIGSHVELALQRKTESDTREMLRRELSHRVGNSLAVLGSLFRRCCAAATDIEDLRARFEPRLHAVGHAHRLIGGHSAAQVELREIVRTAVDLMPELDRVRVEGEDTTLDPKLVLPITLILHEMVTNSVKHGVWHETGQLTVSWQVADGRLQLTWREEPAKPLQETGGQGYGSVLMQAMAEGTMGGQFSKGFEDGAYVARLEVPLG